jgi:hypothetical protein
MISAIAKVAVIVVAGLGFVVLDSLGFSPPTPPPWILAWVGWILSGLGLLFGGELLRAVRMAADLRIPPETR